LLWIRNPDCRSLRGHSPAGGRRVDDTEPDLPLKDERRCGVQPSTASPASSARRPLEASPATRVLTTELRRLSTADSADIVQREAGGPATMSRKQNAARTMGRWFGEGMSAPGQVAQIDVSRQTSLGPPTHDDGIQHECPGACLSVSMTHESQAKTYRHHR
jgi:hypothetical protein